MLSSTGIAGQWCFGASMLRGLFVTDQFGKPISNNVPLVKPTETVHTGIPLDVRTALTHFTNSD